MSNHGHFPCQQGIMPSTTILRSLCGLCKFQFLFSKISAYSLNNEGILDLYIFTCIVSMLTCIKAYLYEMYMGMQVRMPCFPGLG